MPPVTINGDTGIVTPMYNGSITANAVTPSVNMKNRIINGAMTLSQRSGTTSVTTSVGNNYNPDRWLVYDAVGSKLSIQQVTDAPTGFINSQKITSLAATTPASGDYYFNCQRIEGFNVSDLMYGTANALTTTLSFWVKSSLTGSFSGAFGNASFSRSYPFSYTISSANTWEQKTVTVAGDTTGTWATDNSTGLQVVFDLGSGTTRAGTANTWSANDYRKVTGSVNLIGTNGATFYITGVQLEVGSTATSFDYRPYGTELALCQRYYDFLTGGIGGGNQTSTTNCGFSLSFRVPKRAAPTPSLVGTVNANDGGTQTTISSIPSYFYGDANGILMNLTTGSLTSTRATLIYSQSSTAGLALSAEL